jgi:hypothetical protein
MEFLSRADAGNELTLLESQSGTEKAADKAARRVAKVRAILELLTS